MINKLAICILIVHAPSLMASSGYLASNLSGDPATPSRAIAHEFLGTPVPGTPAQDRAIKVAEYFELASKTREFATLELLISRWPDAASGWAPFYVYGNWQEETTGSTLLHALLKTYKLARVNKDAALKALQAMLRHDRLRKDLKDSQGQTVMQLVENDADLVPFEQALKNAGFESSMVVKARLATQTATNLQEQAERANELARRKDEELKRLRDEIAAEEAANAAQERALTLQEEARRKELEAQRLEEELKKVREQVARDDEAERGAHYSPDHTAHGPTIPVHQSPASNIPAVAQPQVDLPSVSESIATEKQSGSAKTVLQEHGSQKDSTASLSLNKGESGLPLGKISALVGGSLALFFGGKRIYEERERQERIDREKQEIQEAE